MKKIFIVRPSQGWETFYQHQELIDFIWENLTEKVNQKIIEYYNLTSDSSIWDDGKSSLSLSFQHNKIIEFTFAYLDTETTSSSLFQFIMNKLRTSFNLDFIEKSKLP